MRSDTDEAIVRYQSCLSFAGKFTFAKEIVQNDVPVSIIEVLFNLNLNLKLNNEFFFRYESHGTIKGWPQI